MTYKDGAPKWLQRDQSALLRGALALAPIAGTAILSLIFGESWLADLSTGPWLAQRFLWLFAAILWASIRVVHYADCFERPNQCSSRLGPPGSVFRLIGVDLPALSRSSNGGQGVRHLVAR